MGRNLIKRLSNETDIWIIDDLSIGRHPDKWLDKNYEKKRIKKNYIQYTNKKRNIHFIAQDVITVFEDEVITAKSLPKFTTIYHLASIVGGRELIDGDPILVGKDLAIDAIFFYWLTRNNRDVRNVLYTSSSAAYPVVLQGKRTYKRLKERDIQFKEYLGIPDMTYGWSKLTGEYLSRLTAKQYSIPIACVRPFSGYGEDQDFSYPIPAIARRIARREDPVTVWGTGKQARDFVHIDDCIDAFFVVMKNISNGDACNIGSGKLTTFLDVIKIFTRAEGYQPKIVSLLNKPVGVASRYANISLLKSYGWIPKMSNEQGFRRVLYYIKEKRME